MLKQYQENRKAVSDLWESLDKKRNEAHEARRKVEITYRDMKWELSQKEREETDVIRVAFEKEEAKTKETLEGLSVILKQVERILAFKGIAKNPPDLSFKVSTYRDRAIELIDTIKTPCLQLRIYIYENDKPKNKYSLVAIGASMFARDKRIAELPRFYGMGLNDHGANINMGFRDAPTIKWLKEYYTKKGSKLLGDFLTQHAELEAEYETVRQDHNTPEWERLYWEDKKEYYEKHYSRGTETDEYKTVLEELKKLS